MDIYHMTSKLGFSAEYVESLSPVERHMYINYYIKEQKEAAEKKKRAESGHAAGPSIGAPIGI